jgi:hypothetical protein
MAEQAQTKQIVILHSKDWFKWLQNVKLYAKSLPTDVWQYIDPKLDEEPAIPAIPSRPKPSDYALEATTWAQVPATQLEIFKIDMMMWKEDQKEAVQIHECLQKCQAYINSTVHNNNVTFYKDANSVWQTIRALRARLSPSNRARELELSNNYAQMKRIGKNEVVNDAWIKKWEDTYTECNDAGLPEVSGDRPLYDFLQAIYAVDESWSTAQGIAFEQMLSMDSQLPTLYVLLERYRNHRRLITAAKPRADTSHNHSAFTAFQFRDQDGNWQLPCVCGVKHQYVDCPYLNEAIHTPGWQKNEKIAAKVANALRKFKVKQQVDKQLANWKKEQEEKAKSNPSDAAETQKKGSWATAIRSSFTGSTDDFLQDCTLLDSACSDHVINHRRKERFVKTRSAGLDDILYAGKDQYQIEAFGNSWIEVMTPTGKERQDLENVAYVPGFLTNCVSLS